MKEERRKEIPDGANLVIIESSMPADSLYAVAKDTVLEAGCEARNSNEKFREFASKPCSPGEYSSQMVGNSWRIKFVVEETSSGSRLESRVRLRRAQTTRFQSWRTAKMDHPAFEELVLLMEDLPGDMSFDTDYQSRQGG